jgi:opacity protein-like surface antigen
MTTTLARLRITRFSRVGAALCCLVASAPGRAIAEEASTDRWEWDATVYLWLPTLDGDTSFPPGDGGPSIDVSADQIIDGIEFVFMGAIETHRGPWGVGTDVVYLDLGASRKGTRDFGIGRIDIPATVNADMTLDVTGWLWMLHGNYTVIDQDAILMHALAGARMLNLEEDLDWTFNGDISSLPLTERSGTSRATDTQWDAVVGVKGRATLGAERHWYLPYHVDVGAGDSDLTWQVMVGLGYTFDAVAVAGVWRYLHYDLGDGTPIHSLEFNGPAVGITFRF